MDEFNLNHIMSRFSSYRAAKRGGKPNNANVNPSANSFIPKEAVSKNSAKPAPAPPNSPQMGNLGGSDTSAYVKDLLKLPRNMNEFIYMMQKNITQMQLNRLINGQMAQRNVLSQTQAQILAQLQGVSTAEIQNALKSQMNTQLQAAIKNLQISANGMINLADISALIQANGKDAITKLILTMANASKQGVTDLSQLKDTAKLINASIALASAENPQQTLKTLLLLYLPWLPLQEGTDFDLEIAANEDTKDSESILVVTITTLNFGNVVATLILETSNSVMVSVECSQKFPKDELLKRIENDGKSYSMQSVVSFTTKESTPQKDESQTRPKVNMSSNYEINPYLLLMAHTIIRNTIIIDNNASNGNISHTDIGEE